MSALPYKVFTYYIQVVEKLAEGGLNHIGLPLRLVGIAIYNHLDTLMNQPYVNIGGGEQRVAVVVYPPVFFPVNVDVLRAESLDFLVLIQRFVHHFNGHLCRFQHVERFHDDDVQQPVAHRSLRSNVGIVAIL